MGKYNKLIWSFMSGLLLYMGVDNYYTNEIVSAIYICTSTLITFRLSESKHDRP